MRPRGKMTPIPSYMAIAMVSLNRWFHVLHPTHPSTHNYGDQYRVSLTNSDKICDSKSLDPDVFASEMFLHLKKWKIISKVVLHAAAVSER